MTENENAPELTEAELELVSGGAEIGALGTGLVGVGAAAGTAAGSALSKGK